MRDIAEIMGEALNPAPDVYQRLEAMTKERDEWKLECEKLVALVLEISAAIEEIQKTLDQAGIK